MTPLPENAVQPASRAEWRAWLEENHARGRGVWLVAFRQATGKRPFGYEESVEEALCFGWIDSKAKKLDEERTLLWYAPRKRGSDWSRSNKVRVERLIAQGRMTPAGMARIDAAKADGSWTRLDEVEELIVPDDLAAAMSALPPAAEHWQGFPRSVKRSILLWIVSAKTATTRAKRIAETATLAQENRRAR